MNKKRNDSYIEIIKPENDSLVFKHLKKLLDHKKRKKIKYRKLSSSLKILYLDIETSPILSLTWGTYNQYISPAQIIHPSSIMCFSALWDHETKKDIMFDSIHESKFSDMMKRLHSLLSEADLVVHYNGKKFDIARINREFIKLNLGPPDRYAQIDLLQIVKAVGGFDSNKLEYVSQTLGIGSKIENAGFPLWIGCMSGDETSWKIMKLYNEEDSWLLKGLYHMYLPWIRVHPNVAIYEAAEGETISLPTCTNCGSTDVIKKGVAKTKTQMYQRYKCKCCGTHLRGRKTILPKESRKNILTQEV